jgi:hypothetical protein
MRYARIRSLMPWLQAVQAYVAMSLIFAEKK